jgi:hypothetical protein
LYKEQEEIMPKPGELEVVCNVYIPPDITQNFNKPGGGKNVSEQNALAVSATNPEGPVVLKVGQHQRTVPGKDGKRKCLDCAEVAYLRVLERTNCGGFLEA